MSAVSKCRPTVHYLNAFLLTLLAVRQQKKRTVSSDAGFSFNFSTAAVRKRFQLMSKLNAWDILPQDRSAQTPCYVWLLFNTQESWLILFQHEPVNAVRLLTSAKC